MTKEWFLTSLNSQIRVLFMLSKFRQHKGEIMTRTGIKSLGKNESYVEHAELTAIFVDGNNVNDFPISFLFLKIMI